MPDLERGEAGDVFVLDVVALGTEPGDGSGSKAPTPLYRASAAQHPALD
ncbi:hypothetical protein OH767_46250 [Streptomyces sp. NBC_01614]